MLANVKPGMGTYFLPYAIAFGNFSKDDVAYIDDIMLVPSGKDGK